MIPGLLIAPGELTDPKVNFVSVRALKPVTVHMSFSLPGATLRCRLPSVQHRINCLAEVPFFHVHRMQKLSRGKGSLAHDHYQCLE